MAAQEEMEWENNSNISEDECNPEMESEYLTESEDANDSNYPSDDDDISEDEYSPKDDGITLYKEVRTVNGVVQSRMPNSTKWWNNRPAE